MPRPAGWLDCDAWLHPGSRMYQPGTSWQELTRNDKTNVEVMKGVLQLTEAAGGVLDPFQSQVLQRANDMVQDHLNALTSSSRLPATDRLLLMSEDVYAITTSGPHSRVVTEACRSAVAERLHYRDAWGLAQLKCWAQCTRSRHASLRL